MKTSLGSIWVILVFIFGCDKYNSIKEVGVKKEILTPVPFNEVELEDHFWEPRLATQKEELVPFALNKTQGAIDALEQTALFLEGKGDSLPVPHRYQSSDLYKVMEGISYLLREETEPGLEARMDELIEIIARAQKEDGYLYVPHITGVSKDHAYWGGAGMGDKPYTWVLHSHELYNMGHMYEGAIAYYQATGKTRWLEVAEKNAKHINQVFFEGDPSYNDGIPVNQAPGHQELELALTKLYRVTGNSLYLKMAKKFLDIRGKTFKPEGNGVMDPHYAQQHKPVAEQRQAVGHAVRATYMYSAMADVQALTGTENYTPALESIWHNVVDTKMSITGGLGTVRGIEGFGPEYFLPNKEAYNETCAAVGNVFFNFRMFLQTMDAKYMDVAEVSLLNNSLAGVNIEGNRFFYVNPLESDGYTPFNHGQVSRSPWFDTACCPSNIARLIPQVTGMMYSYTNTDIYATLYGSNTTSIHLPNGPVKIKQRSKYPIEGKVKLTIFPEKAQRFALKMRIPTWAGNKKFIPGELYQYVNHPDEKWKLKVNGQPFEGPVKNGFVGINRKWKPGDQVELYLPMPVRFNTSDEKVENNIGRFAITRGPLVYAAEGIDNGETLEQFYLNHLPDTSEIEEILVREGLLKDVVKISFPICEVSPQGYTETKFYLVPYYAWNNRGIGPMKVWVPSLAKEESLVDKHRN